MAAPARRLAAAASYCQHALRRALHDRLRAVEQQLRACHRRSLAGASSSSTSSAPAAAAAAALGALLLLCAAFPGATAFFLPLVASTSLCCAAACLFAADERKEAAVEVVMLAGGEGGKPEAGLMQVIGEANASAYCGGGKQQVQVGCFLRRSAKRGFDEDGEEVVFAGTLAPCVGIAGGQGQRRGASAMEEELAALRVDRLAGGVWDSYFGGWSRWHDVDAGVSCS